jgi:uncharacterized glyoxalase superfamily protein PhnB
MQTNRSIPDAVIIPVLNYPDVPAAVRWLCDAFGLVERLRIGDHRVQLTFAGGALVAADRGSPVGGPAGSAERTHSVLVRVDDADAHCARARAAGAEIVSAPTNYPYGERQYTALDLAGHRWTFSQTVADIAPEDWGGELVAP